MSGTCPPQSSTDGCLQRIQRAQIGKVMTSQNAREGSPVDARIVGKRVRRPAGLLNKNLGSYNHLRCGHDMTWGFRHEWPVWPRPALGSPGARLRHRTSGHTPMLSPTPQSMQATDR